MHNHALYELCPNCNTYNYIPRKCGSHEGIGCSQWESSRQSVNEDNILYLRKNFFCEGLEYSDRCFYTAASRNSSFHFHGSNILYLEVTMLTIIWMFSRMKTYFFSKNIYSGMETYFPQKNLLHTVKTVSATALKKLLQFSTVKKVILIMYLLRI